jgi:outer membrane receptor protein involved in Fe transport
MPPCRPASVRAVAMQSTRRPVRPWGGAFAGQGYTSGKWPTKYEPDRVISYELGEKARFLDRRLTVNASIYYEDWRHIQLEAFPNDWALNINGNYAHIYGADIDTLAVLRGGFQLEVSAGYLYEYLDGGPHWVIQPVHRLPDVSPVSGTISLNYSKAVSSAYTFTARVENSYTGPRYSIFFSDPYEFTGTYRGSGTTICASRGFQIHPGAAKPWVVRWKNPPAGSSHRANGHRRARSEYNDSSAVLGLYISHPHRV